MPISDPVIWLIIFIFGLMIGSFLNVLIGRYTELETVVNSRSHCPHCRALIPWRDLIPLLSFVLLRARCRYCREKISWQYPVVELLTALVAVQLGTVYGLTWLAGLSFVITALLIVLAVIDSYDRIIPDEFALPALLLAFIFAFSHQASQPFWAVLLAGGSLAALVILSREQWMGAGDISLGIIMGLLGGLLGSIVGLVVAFGLGSLVGIVGIVLKQKAMKDKIPFGPFLAFGIYVAMVWGNQIANWYLTSVHYY